MSIILMSHDTPAEDDLILESTDGDGTRAAQGRKEYSARSCNPAAATSPELDVCKVRI
jgi:hypothetical protein